MSGMTAIAKRRSHRERLFWILSVAYGSLQEDLTLTQSLHQEVPGHPRQARTGAGNDKLRIT